MSRKTWGGSLLILFLLGLILAPKGFAEEEKVETSSAWGLVDLTFKTPRGAVTVRLPEDAQENDTISGVLVVVPDGKKKKHRKKNRQKLQDMALLLGGKAIPVKDGASFTLENLGVDLVVGLGETGKVTSKTWTFKPDPLKVNGPAVQTQEQETGTSTSDNGQPESSDTNNEPQKDCSCMPFAQQGSPAHVWGSFDGVGKNTQVTVAGQNVQIIAETPRRLFFKTSTENSQLGELTIRISEDGRQMECKMRIVRVSLSADKVDLKPGESSPMYVTVSGLAGLDRDLPMELVNESPKVFGLSQGDYQTFTIHPQDVNQGGIFKISRTMTGRKPGVFGLYSKVYLAGLPQGNPRTR